MKTTIFFLLSLVSTFSIISCTPGDPQVLSAEERERFGPKRDRKKNGSEGGTASGKVDVPQNVEIPMALLIEARHDQVSQVLNKAFELLQAVTHDDEINRVHDENCVRTELEGNSETEWVYQIRYDECPMTAGTLAYVYSGSAQLTLKMNSKKQIEKIAFVTPKIDESTLDQNLRKMVYVLAGDQRMIVQDQTEIVLKKSEQDTNSYVIETHNSLTRIQQGPEESETTYNLELPKSEGACSVESKKVKVCKYATILKGHMTNKSGANLEISLDVTKEESSPDFKYTMTFAGNPRTGVVELTDTKISVKQDPKPGDRSNRKKDPITKDRMKNSEQLDGQMPWDFWKL